MIDIALAMWEERDMEGVLGAEPRIYSSEVRNQSGVMRQTSMEISYSD